MSMYPPGAVRAAVIRYSIAFIVMYSIAILVGKGIVQVRDALIAAGAMAVGILIGFMWAASAPNEREPLSPRRIYTPPAERVPYRVAEKKAD